MSSLSEDQVIDILSYIGVTNIRNFNSKGEIQFCCPIHGESTPSMGYSIQKNVCNCFSCHFSGSISWLVYNARKDEFKSLQEVDNWIKSRYGVDFISWSDKDLDEVLLRYEDIDIEEKTRFELPRYYLAPYRSGKETYKYFFKRGFTRKTMKEFMIGRDLEQKTVTIPLFWEDGKLAGIIGRKISKKTPKNKRYFVYEFPRGELLYPLHKLKPYIDEHGNKVYILVEGILDALWLHQLGFSNAFSVLGNTITPFQIHWIKKHSDIIIDMSDNDEGGNFLSQKLNEELKNIISVRRVTYPKDKKDAQECSYQQIKDMLRQKKKILLERL